MSVSIISFQDTRLLLHTPSGRNSLFTLPLSLSTAILFLSMLVLVPQVLKQIVLLCERLSASVNGTIL
jgi:hypothetical protein